MQGWYTYVYTWQHWDSNWNYSTQKKKAQATDTHTDTDTDVIDDTYGCFTGRATDVVKLRTGRSTGCDRSANCFCIPYIKRASNGLRET